MKKFSILSITLFCAGLMMAQGLQMRVYVGDQVVFAKDVNTIDSIIFVEPEPVQVIDNNGVLNGVFSVSASQKVRFTRGNLQYQASTDTWRFAERQYDFVGDYQRGTIYDADSVKSNNAKISSTYDGWIDLFGWGTSGYNGCMPYQAVFNTAIYGQPGTNYVDLTNSNYDWGRYCVISNGGNQSGLWYTLTLDEWQYLFHSRGNADYLRGFASVDGNNGYILLPDNWAGVISPSFTPNVSNYTTNSYSVDEWKILEELGAVFLPAAGFRWEKDISAVTSSGLYWSATANVEASAMRIQFSSSGANTNEHSLRNGGHAVRLVQKVQ